MPPESSFRPKHAILPMRCGTCRTQVRLEIREPVPTAIRHAWTCDACGTENPVTAKWQVVTILPNDADPATV